MHLVVPRRAFLRLPAAALLAPTTPTPTLATPVSSPIWDAANARMVAILASGCAFIGPASRLAQQFPGRCVVLPSPSGRGLFQGGEGRPLSLTAYWAGLTSGARIHPSAPSGDRTPNHPSA